MCAGKKKNISQHNLKSINVIEWVQNMLRPEMSHNNNMKYLELHGNKVETKF